jgi:hypothetical protein
MNRFALTEAPGELLEPFGQALFAGLVDFIHGNWLVCSLEGCANRFLKKLQDIFPTSRQFRG